MCIGEEKHFLLPIRWRATARHHLERGFIIEIELLLDLEKKGIVLGQGVLEHLATVSERVIAVRSGYQGDCLM